MNYDIEIERRHLWRDQRTGSTCGERSSSEKANELAIHDWDALAQHLRVSDEHINVGDTVFYDGRPHLIAGATDRWDADVASVVLAPITSETTYDTARSVTITARKSTFQAHPPEMKGNSVTTTDQPQRNA